MPTDNRLVRRRRLDKWLRGAAIVRAVLGMLAAAFLIIVSLYVAYNVEPIEHHQPFTPLPPHSTPATMGPSMPLRQ
jgi:hypothetical protein